MELLIHDFFHEKLFSRKQLMELLIQGCLHEKLHLQPGSRRGEASGADSAGSFRMGLTNTSIQA